MSTEHKSHIWLLLGISVALAFMIVAWWSITTGYLSLNTNSIYTSEADNAVTASITSANQTGDINALREMLVDLNKTTALLKDSITYLEAKLIRAHVLSDTLIENGEMLASSQPSQRTGLSAKEASPKPLVPQITVARTENPSEATDASATKDINTHGKITKSVEHREAMSVVARKIHENQQDDSASSGPVSTGYGIGDTWVVNLVSFTNQAQAERFMSNASTKGLSTSLRKVNVKGINYWRVQASGFKTLEEAKNQGRLIKKQLGLNDFWITKH